MHFILCYAISDSCPRLGTVKFIGPMDKISNNDKKIYVGLKMDDPVGNCDGTINGVHFFNTSLKHGRLVRITSIVAVFHIKVCFLVFSVVSYYWIYLHFSFFFYSSDESIPIFRGFAARLHETSPSMSREHNSFMKLQFLFSSPPVNNTWIGEMTAFLLIGVLSKCISTDVYVLLCPSGMNISIKKSTSLIILQSFLSYFRILCYNTLCNVHVKFDINSIILCCNFYFKENYCDYVVF